MNGKKLKRGEGKLLGVCEGLGDHFDVDPTVVRVAFLIAFFGFGTGLLAYIILAIIMPKG